MQSSSGRGVVVTVGDAVKWFGALCGIASAAVLAVRATGPVDVRATSVTIQEASEMDRAKVMARERELLVAASGPVGVVLSEDGKRVQGRLALTADDVVDIEILDRAGKRKGLVTLDCSGDEPALVLIGAEGRVVWRSGQ